MSLKSLNKKYGIGGEVSTSLQKLNSKYGLSKADAEQIYDYQDVSANKPKGTNTPTYNVKALSPYQKVPEVQTPTIPTTPITTSLTQNRYKAQTPINPVKASSVLTNLADLGSVSSDKIKLTRDLMKVNSLNKKYGVETTLTPNESRLAEERTIQAQIKASTPTAESIARTTALRQKQTELMQAIAVLGDRGVDELGQPTPEYVALKNELDTVNQTLWSDPTYTPEQSTIEKFNEWAMANIPGYQASREEQARKQAITKAIIDKGVRDYYANSGETAADDIYNALGASLYNGFVGIPENLGRMGKEIASLGRGDDPDRVEKKLNATKVMNEAELEKIVSKPENARGTLRGTAVELAESMGQNIPGYVMSAINPVAGAATLAGQMAGQAYSEARDMGKSVGRSLAFATEQGLEEYVTDRILGIAGGAIGGSAIGNTQIAKTIKEAVQSLGKTALGKFVAQTALNLTSEGLSEFAQEFLQYYTENASKEAFLGEKSFKGNVGEDLKEALHAGWLGFLNALIMGGGATAINGVQNYQYMNELGKQSDIRVDSIKAIKEALDTDKSHYGAEEYYKVKNFNDLLDNALKTYESGKELSTYQKGALEASMNEIANIQNYSENGYDANGKAIETPEKETTNEVENKANQEYNVDNTNDLEKVNVNEEQIKSLDDVKFTDVQIPGTDQKYGMLTGKEIRDIAKDFSNFKISDVEFDDYQGTLTYTFADGNEFTIQAKPPVDKVSGTYSEATPNTQIGENNGENISRGQQGQNDLGRQVGSSQVQAEQESESRNGGEVSLENQAKADGWAEVTGKTYDAENGTDKVIAYQVPQTYIDTANTKQAQEMRDIQSRAKADGKEVSFVVGSLSIVEDGEDVIVRGMNLGDGKMVVQVDNPRATAEQIYNHEDYHEVQRNNPDLVQRTKENFLKSHSQDELDRIAWNYAEAYGYLTEDIDENTLDDIADKVIEEIFADAYAGISQPFDTENDLANIKESATEEVNKSKESDAKKLEKAEDRNPVNNEVKYSVETPYKFGSQKEKDWVDTLDDDAKQTYDLFAKLHSIGRENKASVKVGVGLASHNKSIDVTTRNMLASEWNDYVDKSKTFANTAKALADALPEDIRKEVHIEKDGHITPTPFENEFKMMRSFMQRVVDALPIQIMKDSKGNNINYVMYKGKKIKLTNRSEIYEVGGEAYRRALLEERRKLYDEGKLGKKTISGLSKDTWGTMGFLASNTKTVASGDFTTFCPQMHFNKGCWYCYRLSALKSGVNNKLVGEKVWYTGEILRLKPKDVEALNETGGLRIQSFGDWSDEYSAQLFDMLVDAEKVGLQIKIITKEVSMIDAIATLKESMSKAGFKDFANNLYFNISADYTLEMAEDEAKINLERPYMWGSINRDENGTPKGFNKVSTEDRARRKPGEKPSDEIKFWKRALSVEEAAKLREKYDWVNTRIVATNADEFIRGLQSPYVDVVTGYHGKERYQERISSENGEFLTAVEPLGDNGMPRFAYNAKTNTWEVEYEGKTSYQKELAKRIQENGLEAAYYFKTCCQTGRCASCKGKCGALARDFNVKNATNRDKASKAYWQKEMMADPKTYRFASVLTNEEYKEMLENYKDSLNKSELSSFNKTKYSRDTNSNLVQEDNTALYIKNTDKADYINMIFNGEKTEETRSRRVLDSFIGKDFYVTDGKYVYGKIKLGEPHKYTSEDFHKKSNQEKHRVPKGDEYDIKENGVKWAYPIESYNKYDKPKLINKDEEYNWSYQARQIKYSRDVDYAPIFYSKLEREVENYKGEKIGASSVESYLKGKGVKEEEIKWSGIRPFLEGKKSVTKQELLDFVKANQLEIVQSTRSDGGWDGFIEDYEYATGREIYEEELNSMSADEMEEHLAYKVDYGELKKKEAKLLLKEFKELKHEATRWSDYKLDDGENYREYLYKLPSSDYTNESMSMHWGGESGVVVHSRVQDFYDSNDNKVLFIEEIQSDWHNEGKRSGYRNEKDVSLVKKYREYEVAKRNYIFKQMSKLYSESELGEFDSQGWLKQETENLNREQVLTMRKQYGEFSDKWDRNNPEKANWLKDNHVNYRKSEDNAYLAPEAPFANNYTDFALKNLLREAAEKGYKYLAWTTGKMQEERWSSQYAEGYRIEYDQDIPKFLNKFGKQFGAKVGTIGIGTSYDGHIDTSSAYDYMLSKGFVQSRDDIERVEKHGKDTYRVFFYTDDGDLAMMDIDSDGVGEYSEYTVPAIEITDAMRKSVLYEGQPRFSRDWDENRAKKPRYTAEEMNYQIDKAKSLQKAKDDEKLALAKAKSNEKLEKAKELRRDAVNRERVSKYEALAKEHQKHIDYVLKKRAIKEDARLRQDFLNKVNKAIRISKKKPGFASEAIKELLYGVDNKSVKLLPTTREELLKREKEILDLAAKDKDFDAQKKDKMLQAVHRVYEKQAEEFTLDEIKELSEQLAQLIHYQQTSDKMLRDSQHRAISDTSNAYIKEIRSVEKLDKDKTFRKALADYTLYGLSPLRAMRRISGYAENSVGENLMRGILDGKTKQIEWERREMQPFEDFFKNKAYQDFKKNVSKQNIEVTIGGQKVKISMGMRVALYLHSKNVDNRTHIASGGLTIPNVSAYEKGNFKDAYGDGTIVHISPTELGNILKDMTSAELEYATLMQSFFRDAADAINDASLDLDGVYKALVEDYFPITSDSNYLESSMDFTQDATLEGWNNLKERTNGNNPILLEDATKVLARHMSKTAQYYGLAIPIRNFTKVFNYTRADIAARNSYGNTLDFDSVKSAIKSTWDSKTADYIVNLIKDINSGGRQFEKGFLEKLRSNYAGATLTLNPSVALKQTTSYFMAGSILSDKALGYGLTHKFTKADEAYMDKITPWGWNRRRGQSTIELGDIAQSKGIFSKVPNWNQAMDVITTNALFVATEKDIQSQYPNLKRGDAEYDKALADKYNEVLWRTQPQYDVAFRPEYLRKTDIGSRTFGMFKTESMQMMGELIDAYGQYKADSKRGNAKEAKKNFNKTLVHWVASNLSFAALGVLLKFALHNVKNYRDDDGDIDPNKVLGDVVSGFASSSVGGLFFGSQAYDISNFLLKKAKGEQANWYDIEVPGVSIINDLVSSSGNLMKVMSDFFNPDKETTAKDVIKNISNFALDISKLTPVGFAQNVYKMLDAIKLYIKDATNGNLGKFESGENLLFLKDTSVTSKQYASRSVNAYAEGDSEKGKDAYNKLVNKEGVDKAEDKIKTILREDLKSDGTLAYDILKGDDSIVRDIAMKTIYNFEKDNGGLSSLDIIDGLDISNADKGQLFASVTDTKSMKAWRENGGSEYDFFVATQKLDSSIPKTDEDGNETDKVLYVKDQVSKGNYSENQAVAWLATSNNQMTSYWSESGATGWEFFNAYDDIKRIKNSSKDTADKKTAIISKIKTYFPKAKDKEALARSMWKMAGYSFDKTKDKQTIEDGNFLDAFPEFRKKSNKVASTGVKYLRMA